MRGRAFENDVKVVVVLLRMHDLIVHHHVPVFLVRRDVAPNAGEVGSDKVPCFMKSPIPAGVQIGDSTGDDDAKEMVELQTVFSPCP